MNKQRSFYTFVGVVLLWFFSFQVVKSNVLISFSYSLHEILAGIFQICTVLLPITLFIYLYFVLSDMLQGRKMKRSAASKTVDGFLLAAVISIVCITYYEIHTVSTVGFYTIDRIYYENGRHYLYIDDRKIELTPKQAAEIELEKSYTLKLKWNSLRPSYGKLVGLDH